MECEAHQDLDGDEDGDHVLDVVCLLQAVNTVKSFAAREGRSGRDKARARCRDDWLRPFKHPTI